MSVPSLARGRGGMDRRHRARRLGADVIHRGENRQTHEHGEENHRQHHSSWIYRHVSYHLNRFALLASSFFFKFIIFFFVSFFFPSVAYTFNSLTGSLLQLVSKALAAQF